MIVSDTYEFVFIHIPKCAGTTIRKEIGSFDDTNGFFAERGDKYEQLGIIDYAHIPLFILEDFFSEEYAKINEYKTFAVIRDPFDRFPSSLSTHLNMHGQKPIRNLGKKDLRSELDKVIDFLSKRDKERTYLPYTYIHFQRQVDFIYHKKEMVVDEIYTISEVNLLLEELSRHIGKDFNKKPSRRKNVSKVYRNNFIKFFMEDIRPKIENLYKPILPVYLKNKLLNSFFVSRDSKFQSLFESRYVTDFVKDYYSEDIRLFEEISKVGSFTD